MASLLKIKNTVVTPKVVIIAAAVINAANTLGIGQDMLITSANDGKHMKRSKHYTNAALDFRTKHLTSQEKDDLVKEVKRQLGAQYDIILEHRGGINEHLHVEFDPK